MTKTIQNDPSSWSANTREFSRWWVIGLLIALSLFAVLKDAKSMNPSQDMLSAIRTLISTPGLSTLKIDHLLGAHLTRVESESDEYFAVFRAQSSTKLPIATGIEFRDPGVLAKFKGFLLIQVDANCIPFAELKTQLPPLKLTQVPRGHARNERVGYSLETTWGVVELGIEDTEAACVRSVSFAPNASVQ